LELRRADLLRGGANPSDGLLEVRYLAVDPDSLAPTENVRRDRRADGEALREQQLLDRDRRRGLAVRPHNVDRPIRDLRVAEESEERAHPIEPEALSGPGAHRVEPFDGRHGWIVGRVNGLERFLSRPGDALSRQSVHPPAKGPYGEPASDLSGHA